MKKIENLFKEASGPGQYSKSYIDNLIRILEDLDHEAVAAIVGMFEQIYERKGRIYFAGNGGSASTCGHFVNDFHAGALRHGGGGYRMIDLTSNIASLTALANDISYDDVFSQQIDRVIEPGDALLVISASGNSKNLIKAVQCAKSRGALTIGLLGFDGGQLKKLCDLSLVVATAAGQYGPVEDVHLVLNHLISTYLTFRKKV